MLGPLLPSLHDTLHPAQGFCTESVTEGLPGHSEVEPLAVTLGALGAVPAVTTTACEAMPAPQPLLIMAV